jgi:hypothetical protein
MHELMTGNENKTDMPRGLVPECPLRLKCSAVETRTASPDRQPPDA